MIKIVCSICKQEVEDEFFQRFDLQTGETENICKKCMKFIFKEENDLTYWETMEKDIEAEKRVKYQIVNDCIDSLRDRLNEAVKRNEDQRNFVFNYLWSNDCNYL